MIHRPWEPINTFLPLLAQSLLPRTKGLHLSELYSVLHPQKRGNTFTQADLELFGIGGFAVERVLEVGLAELMTDRCGTCTRPGELTSVEGIIGSPDLFFYEEPPTFPEKTIVIGDIKAKWMSTKDMPMHEGENEFPPALDKNFSQLMGYLHMLSERDGVFYNRGRIIIYFVNGDWRPTKPALHAWDLEWSRQEIEENWDALISVARDLK